MKLSDWLDRSGLTRMAFAKQLGVSPGTVTALCNGEAAWTSRETAARIAEITKGCEIVHAEMAPGDGLFFHCNTLHRSDQNRSPNRRWTVLMCYNAARNNPVVAHHHPFYTPLSKVPDTAVKAAGMKFAAPADVAHFMHKPVAPPELKRSIEADTLR